MGLTLGITLKFYTSVAKGLKLKVRKLWRLIQTFVEVIWDRLVWCPFWLIQSWIGLITDDPGPLLSRITTVVKLTGAYFLLLKTTKGK